LISETYCFSKQVLSFGSSQGSYPDISQKYKMGDISKGVARPTHSSPPKKLQNVYYLIALKIPNTPKNLALPQQ
jgi:hypothetical protein